MYPFMNFEVVDVGLVLPLQSCSGTFMHDVCHQAKAGNRRNAFEVYLAPVTMKQPPSCLKSFIWIRMQMEPHVTSSAAKSLSVP